MSMPSELRIREIPYNYTSFSDREIVRRLLDESAWQLLNNLRQHRQTGRSAKMLLEILGDIWVVERNPYIQTDLLNNRKRKNALVQAMQHRLQQIRNRAQQRQAVLTLIASTEQAIATFDQQLECLKKQQSKVFKQLKKITSKDNICFDGGSRVAHATDATDWRVEFPFCVLKPDSEAELLPLIQTCISLELTIIPRGGGTGYTGGAIPLTKNSVVLNTEKLEHLSAINMKMLNNRRVATVRAEAGVVTRRISDLAAGHGLVFAVDPTSQDASTIGGNIAMNAGGKKAVLWGTTLDNLLSWRMITADNQWLEVERLNHNLGKIHQQELAEFKIIRYQADRKTRVGKPQYIRVPGQRLRKVGLGKDVTDKFLQGLPGIQKEGCDGLITSAEFVLHQPPKHSRTICLEFFGSDLKKATPAIVEIKDYIDALLTVELAGLEHLDQRYLRAVKYNTKAPRAELPKMVLLADIVSDDEDALSAAASNMIKLANQRQGEGFTAVSAEARKRFWLDRARTAAIAAHTNAFKINEDVVIPLDRLAEYSDSIEHINIEYSMQNKLQMLSTILDYLNSDLSAIKKPDDIIDDSEYQVIIANKKHAAIKHINTMQQWWQALVNNLDQLADANRKLLTTCHPDVINRNDTIFDILQRRDLVISYKSQVANVLNDIFSGRDYKPVRDKIAELHDQVLTSRLFVALHMHAGDGNVHTNIPVNSNDYQMLQQAEKIVERVMALAKSLDGVISGEHGIGITKMQFIEPETIEAFSQYKQQVDPKHYFNRGKLMAGSGLANAYTPSLQLLSQEALLLEASELGDLNHDIKDCLRCGKCKPVCMTHVPKANLFYSPRDKILATGSIIEAFLYEEQTRRGVSIQHFDAMNDVADHCTTCHKCFNPCPVNIDFGDVTIKMRNILKRKGKKNASLGTTLSMLFLNVNSVTAITLLRLLLMKWGFVAQRLLNALYNLAPVKKQIPPATTGKTSVKEQVIHFIKRPMPKGLPSKTMRSLLGAEDDKTIPIIRDSKATENPAIFYFPGCGSERLFSQVGLATIAMLYHAGTQVVLPPGYLCCGYPQNAVGDGSKAKEISVSNQVLFHRMANTLNYLDIKTVIVSCGTCIDQLQKYQFEKIFPGCRLLDIHEYLMEQGLQVTDNQDTQYIYHDPCHSPMKQHNPIDVTKKLLATEVVNSKFCCGDAGTLSMSRPDIATQLKYRKSQQLEENKQQLTSKNIKILTSCPACLKGLSSYRKETGLKADYIVVELAYRLLGKEWQKNFVNTVQNGGVERVLL